MAATVADEAFEHLYTRYGREVYRYALALLRNPSEAEDVTQTTFLNAYRALRAGERPRRPHNWLIAIAHNVCRSRVRFAMRRPKEVPLDDVVEQLAVPEAERPNIRELLRTIRRLPLNQRAAITMRELEGRSYADIAETLGVTVPAAEALIGRARRTLRSHAASFRSLLLLPLPRSLRKLGENGEVAGGAVGTAAAAKVVALLVVGAVGGGIGIAAGGGSQLPAARAVPAPPAQQLVSRSAPATNPTGQAAVPARTRAATLAAQPAQVSSAIANGSVTASPATSSTPTQAAPAAAGPTTAVAAGTTAAATTAATTAGATATAGAVATVTEAITTVVSALPTVTTPPVSTPAATTPAVTTPAVTTPVATVPPVTVTTVTVPSVTVPPIP
jgi:RNA polymerase sigma factor (sigma-70 family)